MAAKRASEPVFAYVGSFTTEKRRARGDGIHGYRVDTATGRWRHVEHVADQVNPSWLIANRAGTRLYVGHGDETYIDSFVIDRDSGRLSHLNRAQAGGRNIVRMMLDPAEKFMISANYGTAGIAVFPIAADGAIGKRRQLIDIPGEPRRGHRVPHQESSHPHDIHFDPSGRWVLVPDKGLDNTFVLRFDARRGRLAWANPPALPARTGAAPRHVAFHPERPFTWILNESDSSVTTCRWDARRGRLTALDLTSTLPGDFTGDNLTAEIAYHAPSRTLYATNRGYDSIALFRVDQKTGLIRPFHWEKRGITFPRYIGIDPTGRFLYAANEHGHRITPFRIDRRSGRLVPLGQSIRTGSPVTIAFA